MVDDLYVYDLWRHRLQFDHGPNFRLDPTAPTEESDCPRNIARIRDIAYNMAMSSTPLYSLKDLFRSVVLGVLVGWLLISIHDPEHKRFEFKVTDTVSAERVIG